MRTNCYLLVEREESISELKASFWVDPLIDLATLIPRARGDKNSRKQLINSKYWPELGATQGAQSETMTESSF